MVLLAEQKNIPFSEEYLRNHGIKDLSNVTNALQLTLKYNLTDLQEVILDNIESFVQKNFYDLGQICQLAITWNHPEILDRILTWTKSLGLCNIFKGKTKQ